MSNNSNKKTVRIVIGLIVFALIAIILIVIFLPNPSNVKGQFEVESITECNAPDCNLPGTRIKTLTCVPSNERGCLYEGQEIFSNIRITETCERECVIGELQIQDTTPCMAPNNEICVTSETPGRRETTYFCNPKDLVGINPCIVDDNVIAPGGIYVAVETCTPIDDGTPLCGTWVQSDSSSCVSFNNITYTEFCNLGNIDPILGSYVEGVYDQPMFCQSNNVLTLEFDLCPISDLICNNEIIPPEAVRIDRDQVSEITYPTLCTDIPPICQQPCRLIVGNYSEEQFGPFTEILNSTGFYLVNNFNLTVLGLKKLPELNGFYSAPLEFRNISVNVNCSAVQSAESSAIFLNLLPRSFPSGNTIQAQFILSIYFTSDNGIINSPDLGWLTTDNSDEGFFVGISEALNDNTTILSSQANTFTVVLNGDTLTIPNIFVGDNRDPLVNLSYILLPEGENSPQNLKEICSPYVIFPDMDEDINIIS